MPFPRFLGREERLEEVRLNGLVHADSGIADDEHDVAAFGSAGCCATHSASRSAFAVSTVRLPPWGIASRALSARFRMICSICPGSAETRSSGVASQRHELDVLADQPAQQRVHARHDSVQIENLRLEDLLAAEREELTREAGRARRGVADLVDVAVRWVFPGRVAEAPAPSTR